MNEALTGYLPRRMRRRAWQVAIDLHLSPYYGQPHKSRNEIYYGAAKARHEAISRLCLGLHCAVWAALHHWP